MEFNNNWSGVDSSPIITVTRQGQETEAVELHVDAKDGLHMTVSTTSEIYSYENTNCTVVLDRETACELARLLTFYFAWGRLPVDQTELVIGQRSLPMLASPLVLQPVYGSPQRMFEERVKANGVQRGALAINLEQNCYCQNAVQAAWFNYFQTGQISDQAIAAMKEI